MAQALATQGLTEKEAGYVRHVASGREPIVAAKLAGFKFPAQEVSRLNARRDVVAALQATLTQKIHSTLAPLAINRLERELRDPLFRGPPLVRAMEMAIKMAGYAKPRGEGDESGANTQGPLDKRAIGLLLDAAKERLARYENPVIEHDPFGLSTP